MALFKSSTRNIPDAPPVPRHIAVIMDGNGRWAKQRFMPRVAGHQRGVEALREVVKACRDLGVEYLTVFAFSSENWRRPADEVSFLMSLFMKMLEREVVRLHEKNIRVKIIGDRSRFDDKLNQAMQDAETLTANNVGLTLTIAANYGGRWDVMNAVQTMLKEHPEFAQGFKEEDLSPYLCLSEAPEPDLFIRTGGEQRISNFMLWQLAYTELYFTDVLWPAFGREELEAAIASYQKRERRFGRTSEQLASEQPKGGFDA
ncbi:isoprenyl transferase [Ferrigenium kumadai]|uniref:Isoprenyl transferase n=1 Tax=Ferrigenium kumadai TaxID=1682490 RepID=A0AAN1W0C3_9PROT|nr:isoprenyl transferase [Ferrigenium kumadai]BBI99501.1 isoprenyl transferase [Ferrigenium kumadai]